MVETFLALLMFALPVQAFEKPVRIGVLTPAWGAPGGVDELIGGLVELGYRENNDFIIGVRFTSGKLTALPEAARGMVEFGVDIIIADGEPAAKAVLAITSTHPIIFLGAGHPVGRGLVASFSQTGANMTGVTSLGLEVTGKRLQVFKELVPGLRRFVFPYDARDKNAISQADAYRRAALLLGLEMTDLPLNSVEEVRSRLGGLSSAEVQGVVVPEDVGLNIPGAVPGNRAAEGHSINV